MIHDIHLGLGFGLLVLVAVTLVVAGPAAIRGKAPPPAYPPLQRAVAVLILVQVVVGLLLFIIGKRPQTNLHLVYALVAVAMMPAARSMARRDPSKARLYQVGGIVLLLGIVYRLITTG